MSLDKDTFLSLRAPVETVPVPQWGRDVFLRVMSGIERFSWMLFTKSVGDNPSEDVQSSLLARCICDERGARLFTDSAEDVAAISAMDSTALELLGKRALRINGLGSEGADDAKKNLKIPQSDSSSV